MYSNSCKIQRRRRSRTTTKKEKKEKPLPPPPPPQPTEIEGNMSDDSNNMNTAAKIPVDRDWIEKLLRKHSTTEKEVDTNVKLKAMVVAPMVDQSDLPFRLLCRKYGANLCVTPMIHSRLLVTSEMYRSKFIGNFIPEDRPLIAQICGSDPETVLKAAKYVEPYVDGIVSLVYIVLH